VALKRVMDGEAVQWDHRKGPAGWRNTKGAVMWMWVWIIALFAVGSSSRSGWIEAAALGVRAGPTTSPAPRRDVPSGLTLPVAAQATVTNP
jgi:hypothetical protein